MQAIGAKSSDKTGWRNNINAENRTIQGFQTVLPSTILTACERLKHTKEGIVQIENQDIFYLMQRYDRETTLMYLDPPYVLSTRSKRIYKHEFTNDDHVRLLEFCIKSKAKIIISGYDNDIYESYLHDWNRDDIVVNCESGKKRKEVIWMNYDQEGQLNIF